MASRKVAFPLVMLLMPAACCGSPHADETLPEAVTYLMMGVMRLVLADVRDHFQQVNPQAD